MRKPFQTGVSVMTSFTSSEVQKKFSEVRKAAASGPVTITANGRPTFVIMSIAQYREKVEGKAPPRMVALPELSDFDPDQFGLDADESADA